MYRNLVGSNSIYHSLAGLPEKVEVVDIVVPRHVTEGVVKETHRLGLNRV